MSVPGAPTAVHGAASDAEIASPIDIGLRAWRHWPAVVRFGLVAVLGLTLDLWSKAWAFRTFEFHGPPHVVVPHVLEFQTVVNRGALFGIGEGLTAVFLVASLLALLLVLYMFAHSEPRRWVFQLALGAILAGALGNMYDRVFVQLVRYPVEGPGMRYWEVRPVPTDEATSARAVELRLFPPRAGRETVRPLGTGQVEELERPVGHVRDFIKIPTTVAGRELWPWVFNVADVLLVCGVCVLAIGLWRDGGHEQPASAKSAPIPDPSS